MEINITKIIVNVLGGLAIFLYGMLFMNRSITKVAGQKFRDLLLAITGNPIRGLLSGLGVTMIIQSSSATTVMLVGLVGAGLVTFTQSLGVILGAEIGTTITAQLVAFKITKYALPICAIGFFSHFLCKTVKSKSIAKTILGLGLLFLGMGIMSKSLNPLIEYKPFLNMMATVENPILGTLVGLGFTLIIQSSSATSGIVVAMALSGTITLAQAIPICLGSNIGTCIKAILGSITLNKEAKRSAYAHLSSQTFGVILVLILFLIPYQGSENIWFYFVKWFTKTIIKTEDLARQIAMSHTLVAVMKNIILLPLLPLFAKLFLKIFPAKEEEEAFGPKYVNTTPTDVSSIALEAAKKEILRVGEIVQKMLKDSINILKKKDSNLIEQIKLSAIKAHTLRNAIFPYLSKIAQEDLSEKESKEEISFLYIVNEFEEIGDIIAQNIVPLNEEMISHNYQFSEEGWKEITHFHKKILKQIKKIIACFEKKDNALAKHIAESKATYGKMASKLRMSHICRIHKKLKESMETSDIHFNLIAQYRAIHSHISNIAYIILGKIN